MTDRERAQIALIVQRCLALAAPLLDERIRSVYAEHSAAGRLQSGATITVAVRKMDDIFKELVPLLVVRIAEVSTDAEALTALNEAVQSMLEAIYSRLEGVVRKVGGVHRTREPDPPLLAAAEDVFRTWRKDVEAQLAIIATDFVQPSKPPEEVSKPAASTGRAKGGGREPAAFWDELWCAIWGLIYRGEFIPKTQAEVERQMLRWALSHGHELSEAAARIRARRLFREYAREADAPVEG